MEPVKSSMLFRVLEEDHVQMFQHRFLRRAPITPEAYKEKRFGWLFYKEVSVRRIKKVEALTQLGPSRAAPPKPPLPPPSRVIREGHTPPLPPPDKLRYN